MQVFKQNMPPVASTTPSSAAPPVESHKQSTVQRKPDPRIPSGEALAQKWVEELNRNVVLDAEVDEAIRSQLSAKEWTQAKAEKIAAEVRAAQAKRAPD